MLEPRRILLVRLSHLGDVVHALPVFHALREGHPDAQIAWAIQPEFANLIEGLPGLERVFYFDRGKGVSAWLRLGRELRKWRPDLAVDCQGNLKSAAVTRISGARRRAGFHRYDWREPAGARVLTETALRVTKTPVHALDRAELLVQHLVPGARLRSDLALTTKELARGAKAWIELGGERNALLIHLSAQADIRSWPVHHVEQLARIAAQEGRAVLILSGPSETSEGQRLAAELASVPRVRHEIGQLGQRELAALFHAAAESAAQLVACDSGPMHIAVACGLRVIALAGPQDPLRTGPRDIGSVRKDHRIVRALDAPDCAPCLARSCQHDEGPICMSRIAPEQVLQAAQSPMDCAEGTRR